MKRRQVKTHLPQVYTKTLPTVPGPQNHLPNHTKRHIDPNLTRAQQQRAAFSAQVLLQGPSLTATALSALSGKSKKPLQGSRSEKAGT